MKTLKQSCATSRRPKGVLGVIWQVAKAVLLSLGGGFLCQLAQDALGSQYLNDFLKANLVNLLVTLLAVNSATMGIVLTKIRELVENHGHADSFRETREQFLLSIKEQVFLIGAAVVLLTVQGSKHLVGLPNLPLFLWSALAGVFIYGMMILYDTAKGVLIIIDYDPPR